MVGPKRGQTGIDLILTDMRTERLVVWESGRRYGNNYDQESRTLLGPGRDDRFEVEEDPRKGPLNQPRCEATGGEKGDSGSNEYCKDGMIGGTTRNLHDPYG